MAIVIMRTVIVYFSLLLTMRLLGKRQLGELELSEFVLAALIADLAAHPLQDIGIPMINGLVPIVTLFCCEVLISGLSMRSIRFRALLYGKPSILIEKGKINQREMRSNRFTLDELMQELRNRSITDISTVEYAILETNGQLNVILRASEQPVKAAMLGLNTEDKGYTSVIISDGRVLGANLKKAGLNRQWLAKRLSEAGIDNAGQIYLMTVNSEKQTYISVKERL